MSTQLDLFEEPKLRRRAAGILLEHGGRCLLVQRADHMRVHPGTWGIPGGFLERGEDAMSGAVRELFEEIGIMLWALPGFRIQERVVIETDDVEYTAFIISTPNLRPDPLEYDQETADAMWLYFDDLDELDLFPGMEDLLARAVAATRG